MYYLYHIPGKKIGVTQNPSKRITKEQGYNEDEYEILLKTEDIDVVSDLELRLQESFGYRKDMKPYKKSHKTKNENKRNRSNHNIPLPIK